MIYKGKKGIFKSQDWITRNLGYVTERNFLVSMIMHYNGGVSDEVHKKLKEDTSINKLEDLYLMVKKGARITNKVIKI